EVFERDPAVEGLVLLNHGLFTFADDARTAYGRMIAGVDRAERYVQGRERSRRSVARGAGLRGTVSDAVARLAPVLRGALAEPTQDPDRPWRRSVLEHRVSDEILEILSARDADAIAGYRAAYDAYFERNRHRARTSVTKLDSSPRVILVPGVGIFATGRTKKDARIAADIAEHTLRAKALANSIGRYTPLPDADLFDMEYWSLEQAKLGRAKESPLAGQVALVTGGAGAIGFAI